jgi:CTP:molybdopterin cytidylyltransferase MocA
MGGPKAFTRFGDRTFLERILDRCAESGSAVTVTVDPRFKARVLALLKSRPMPRAHLHLRWVEVDGRQPMLASVQAALAAGGCEAGCWLWPVDAPFLSPAGWRLLCSAVAANAAQILKPQSDGRSGHPVWFPGWAVPRMLQGHWPNGLLGFLAECPPEQFRKLDLPGEHLNDVDTPEELAAMHADASPTR